MTHNTTTKILFVLSLVFASHIATFAQNEVSEKDMTKIYDKMVECDYNADAWQIEGADHEGTFWSQEVYNVIKEFLKKNV